MKILINKEFDIPGSTPQQRKAGGGAASHPTQGLRYARAAWRALVEPYRPAKPMRGAVELTVNLCYHTADRKKLEARYKTTRPDGDNMLKIIKDAMTGAGFWEDDAQVAVECIVRSWTNQAESVIIEALELEE